MNKTDNKHNVSLGTLYDFNKQVVLKEGCMSKKELEKIKPELANWFKSVSKNTMLLCRERYDFTVFQLYTQPLLSSPEETAVNELIEVLNNRGKILSIEKDSNVMNNAWEIWVEIDKGAFAYYLFDCDDWVIPC